MKEEYLEPELKILCFAPAQQIAVSFEGGEGNETSGEHDGDLDLDIS